MTTTRSHTARMLTTAGAACAFVLLTGCAGGGGGGATTGGGPARSGSAAPAPTDASMTGISTSAPLSRSELRERAIGALSDLAFDPSPEVRANAIEGLQSVPSRAEPIVRAALQDQNLAVRYVAAMTIGQLRLRSSAPMVRPLLNDTSPLVRAAAIFALHRTGHPQDLTPIADLLTSGNYGDASSAAFILGEIGDPSAAPMLRSAALRASYDIPESRNLRLTIAEALYKLGDMEASYVLNAALYPNSVEGFEQAALAAQIIGSVGDENAVSQLIRLIEDAAPGSPDTNDPARRVFLYPPELRLACATSLARLGYPDGWYVGEQYRNDPNPALRAQAAHTLGRTGLARDAEALSQMLDDSDPRVRAAAAAGLLNAIERPTRPKPRRSGGG